MNIIPLTEKLCVQNCIFGRLPRPPLSPPPEFDMSDGGWPIIYARRALALSSKHLHLNIKCQNKKPKVFLMGCPATISVVVVL